MAEYRLLVSAGRYHAHVPGRGEFFLSSAMCAARDAWPTGPTFESMRDNLPEWGGFLMATAPVSREDLIEAADPRLRAVLSTIDPAPAPPMWSVRVDVRFGREIMQARRRGGTRPPSPSANFDVSEQPVGGLAACHLERP